MIGITQPRRVAAVSMARRVADELNSTCDGKGLVGYQIRYDHHTVGPNTKVKFMTDGILLKEVSMEMSSHRRSNLISFFAPTVRFYWMKLTNAISTRIFFLDCSLALSLCVRSSIRKAK